MFKITPALLYAFLVLPCLGCQSETMITKNEDVFLPDMSTHTDASQKSDLSRVDVGAISDSDSGPTLPIDLPSASTGNNLLDCIEKLDAKTSGWCEMRVSDAHPSISSVWPESVVSRETEMDNRIHMIVGPSSVLRTWTTMAFDQNSMRLYFTGGGHADYGGNELYQFDLAEGKWSRLTDPSHLDHLFVARDYNEDAAKPWRSLCWMPDVTNFPGSAHTYDGFIFSKRTNTLFLYVMGAANGSCFEDEEDTYKNNPLVSDLAGRRESVGWYEFNPSPTEDRHGISPLTWKRVFDWQDLNSAGISQGYPRSLELDDGTIIFGQRNSVSSYDPLIPDIDTLVRHHTLADYGDGTLTYNSVLDRIYSLHGSALIEIGEDEKKVISVDGIAHGKSMAFDDNGKAFSWDGTAVISTIDLSEQDPSWTTLDWAEDGPELGDTRVYGKWRYIAQHDVFVGISSHTTGVWVYRHPKPKPKP